MLQLDQPVLSAVALILWRLRSGLGLKHWAILSCIDAIFAGFFTLFLLVSQGSWGLLALPVFVALSSARKREFLPQEETADLLNQPIKNPRQESLPFCCLRFGSYLIYASLLVDCMRLGKLDWLTAPPLIAGIAKALAEAADIYPTGKAIRDRSKVFFPLSAKESFPHTACLAQPGTA